LIAYRTVWTRNVKSDPVIAVAFELEQIFGGTAARFYGLSAVD
jgi:hypothetical protein